MPKPPPSHVTEPLDLAGVLAPPLPKFRFEARWWASLQTWLPSASGGQSLVLYSHGPRQPTDSQDVSEPEPVEEVGLELASSWL